MNKKFTPGQVILNIIFIAICLAFIIPFILVISISFSDEKSIIQYGYSLLPKVFSTEAYGVIFRNPHTILTAYKTTIIFTVVTMILAVFIMGLMAYPISRPTCRFRKFLSFFIFFTMLFNGGLVPSYLINTKILHLGNTMWIYILPGIVSAWNIIIIRTFYQGLPSSLMEAAKIDGASEWKTYFKIIMPLSVPAYATIGFMVALGKWNDWNTALIYIQNPDLYSLQYMLQKILREAEFLNSVASDGSGLFQNQQTPTESMRYAMAVLAAGPMMFVFPFFQKYFSRGLTVGSVKG